MAAQQLQQQPTGIGAQRTYSRSALFFAVLRQGRQQRTPRLLRRPRIATGGRLPVHACLPLDSPGCHACSPPGQKNDCGAVPRDEAAGSWFQDQEPNQDGAAVGRHLWAWSLWAVYAYAFNFSGIRGEGDAIRYASLRQDDALAFWQAFAA